MKTRHLAILAIVFLSLLGLVKALEYLNRDEGKTIVQEFVSVDTSKVDKIELLDAGDRNVLVKTGAGWKLSEPIEYPANQMNVETLLSKLDDFQTDTIISTSEEKQGTFEVNDQTGIKVTLYSGDTQLDAFYVGKAAPDYNHTYVRAADSNEIKTARGSLQSTFGKKTLEWRDKTILALDSTQLAKISFARPNDDTFSLVKDTNGNWIVDGMGGTLDSTKTSSLTSSLTALNATDFVDDPTTVELNFDEPSLQVQAELTNGQKYTISFVVQDDKYFVKKSDSDQIFVVAKYSYDNLNKQPADLLSSAS